MFYVFKNISKFGRTLVDVCDSWEEARDKAKECGDRGVVENEEGEAWMTTDCSCEGECGCQMEGEGGGYDPS